MFKKFIKLVCFVCLAINVKAQVTPSQTTEYCPNIEYTFQVSLPGSSINITLSGGSGLAMLITQGPTSIVPASN